MSTIKISYSKYVIDLLYNCDLSERLTAYLLAAHDAGIWKKGPVSSTQLCERFNLNVQQMVSSK
ncbi:MULTISPECIES: hypothetical protein [unclassified Wolbachia]|uniref:hypothetical protein n=1 Tax=unclassified Wolbachia TaxID=2640676 RepID=UPI0022300ECE|nr:MULTISPECIES: hypothetical protein [unclassified Wolbachia]